MLSVPLCLLLLLLGKEHSDHLVLLSLLRIARETSCTVIKHSSEGYTLGTLGPLHTACVFCLTAPERTQGYSSAILWNVHCLSFCSLLEKLCRELFEATPHTKCWLIIPASCLYGRNCRVLDIQPSSWCRVRQIEATIVGEHMRGEVASCRTL